MKSRLHHAPKNDRTKCVLVKGYPWIERLPNDEAHRLVTNGQAVYVPKKDWKAQEKKKAA